MLHDARSMMRAVAAIPFPVGNLEINVALAAQLREQSDLAAMACVCTTWRDAARAAAGCARTELFKQKFQITCNGATYS